MKRIGTFDFLRFVAAVFMVLHHYQQLVGVYFQEGINFCSETGTFTFAYLVEFFFILSGLLAVKYIKYIQEGLAFKDFFQKKYVRLFPLMAASAVVYEVLIYLFGFFNVQEFHWMFSLDINIWGTVITALGIQAGGAFANPQINNPLWYVSVLLLCYILLYVVVRVGKKKNINVGYLVIFMIFLAVGIRTYGIAFPFFNVQSAKGYIPFFFGVLIGMFFENRDSKKKEVVVSILVITILLMLIIFQYDNVESNIDYVMTFLFYPALITIFNSATAKKIFSFKIFHILGNISYGMFVWHVDLILAMFIAISALNLEVNIYSRVAMYLFAVVCILVGILSHYLYERPAIKYIEKKIALKKAEYERLNKCS